MTRVPETSAGPPRCRLCGGSASVIAEYDLSRIQPKWKKTWGLPTDIRILRCDQYGSYTTEAPPGPEWLARQYAHGRHGETYSDPDRSPAHRVQRSLTRIAPYLHRGAALIDVGGGDGSFAIAAAAAGYESWLNEVPPVDEAGLAARGVRFAPALSVDLEGRFDAVTLWDVFEHVWPHREFLAPIHRILTPTGKLFLDLPTPTRATPIFRTIGRAAPSPRRERALAYIVSFTHVQLMEPDEVVATLPDYGFEVQHVERSSELSYRGVAYARRLVDNRALARAIGAVVDVERARRVILGQNKAFVVARPVAAAAVRSV